MDIGLVDQQDRAGGLVLQRPGDVLLGGQGAGRVVGVADIDDAGLRIGGDHRLDVVGAVGGQRNLDDPGLAGLGRVHACLVGRIGRDEAARRRGEGQHAVVQGLGRAGIDHDVFGLEAVLGGEGAGQEVGLAVQVVAPAQRRHAGDRLAGRLGRAQRVLIGVDQHRAGRRNVRALAVQRHAGGRGLGFRCEGQLGLGQDRRGGRDEGRAAQEGSATQRRFAGGPRGHARSPHLPGVQDDPSARRAQEARGWKMT